MATLAIALLLLPGAFCLPASSSTNGNAAAPCVSRVPQTSPSTDLKMTVWDHSNCGGSAGTPYPLVYDQNSYQNASFKSYTLSRALQSNERIDFSRPPQQSENPEDCQIQCGVLNGTLTLSSAKDVPNNGSCYEVVGDIFCFRLSTFNLIGSDSSTSASAELSSSSTTMGLNSHLSSASDNSHDIIAYESLVSSTRRSLTTTPSNGLPVSDTSSASSEKPISTSTRLGATFTTSASISSTSASSRSTRPETSLSKSTSQTSTAVSSEKPSAAPSSRPTSSTESKALSSTPSSRSSSVASSDIASKTTSTAPSSTPASSKPVIDPSTSKANAGITSVSSKSIMSTAPTSKLSTPAASDTVIPVTSALFSVVASVTATPLFSAVPK